MIRTSFTSAPPCELPPHVHTKHRPVLPRWHSQTIFSHSSTRWWHLVGGPNSRKTPMYTWAVTARLPVLLPLPYSLDLPQYSPHDTAVLYYKLMDLSDISSDIPDVMSTMSDEVIPDLDAIFWLQIQTMVYINFFTIIISYVNITGSTWTCFIGILLQ